MPAAAGDRRGPQPAGDAADAHEVRHHEVAGLDLQRRVQLARAVEVLADLDRRLQLGGEPRIAVEIVVDDRLLDPGQARDRRSRGSAAAPRPRLRPWLKSTISSMSSPTARRTASMRRKIVARRVAPEPELEAGEAALVAQLDRLGGDGLRALQPQPVAVVGPHRADRAAEQHAERQPAALASASQAAMSSPDTAIIDRPS